MTKRRTDQFLPFAPKPKGDESETLRAQIERMLNQSGSSITPEILASTGMFQISEHNNDHEWTIILVGLTPMKITFDGSKYTVTK